MGYILPIQQHEYSDYQRRMVTRKRNISSVERPYKSILQSQYEELQQEEEQRNMGMVALHTQEEAPKIDMDDLIKELEGLGNFINKRV
ncbi:hypothetical protein [Ornithinibacillus scapharcae]|uniref:hypothetical protein n=1 Tax=Ornithinibacillus scapharcae TaxID=1147159 RepID=UPI000225B28F|nr:hypothetical protein [Ornithinibacillus scapharcae]